MRFSAAAVVCLLAAASGTCAVKPGEYALQWTVPKPEQAQYCVMKMGRLAAVPAERRAALSGLVSEDPLWTTIGDWTLVLDERTGTATGYDTAYLLRSPLPEGQVDLAGAVRLELKADESSLRSDPGSAPMVETAVGGQQAPSAGKAAVGVILSLVKDTERGVRPATAMVILAGHYQGRAAGDDAEYEIALVDKNANGAFDDAVTLDEQTGKPSPGDLLGLRRLDGEWAWTPLAKTVLFEGKLYSVRPSRSGGSVRIESYSGPTGSLRFETLDGKGSLVQTGETVSFASLETGSLTLKSGDEVVVPPGEYFCSPSVTFGPRKKRGEPGFIATVKTVRTARVEADAKTVFSIGGPVSLKIEPETDVPVWPIQKNVQMKLFIYAGEDELASLGLPEPPLTVLIRDAAGRLVARAQTAMNLGNPRMIPLKMPASLVPGPHWVTVTFQPGEYQPGATIEANKPAEVTSPGS